MTLLAILIALAAVLLFQQTLFYIRDVPMTTPHKVQEFVWETTEQLRHRIRNTSEPVRLVPVNSSVQVPWVCATWNSFQDLHDTVGADWNLGVAFNSTSPTMPPFAGDHPLTKKIDGHGNVIFAPYEPMVNLTLERWAEIAVNPAEFGHVYYSQPLEKFHPKGHKFVDPVDIGIAGSKKHASPQLWLTGKNVHFPISYDMAHNVYLQAAGKREITLFRPEALSQLQLFPMLHPLHRKSQMLNVSAFDSKDVSSSSQLKNQPLAYQHETVVLNPGDMIYIPPFWPHSSRDLEPGIACNVLSHTPVLKPYDAIRKIGFPEVKEKPLGRRRVLGRTIVTLVLNFLFREEKRNSTARDFLIDNLYTQRYAQIYPYNSTYDAKMRNHEEKDPNYESRIPGDDTFGPGLCGTNENPSNDELLSLIDLATDKIVPQFMKIPQPLRDVLLADWVEIALFHHYIMPFDIPRFIHRCFPAGGDKS